MRCFAENITFIFPRAHTWKRLSLVCSLSCAPRHFSHLYFSFFYYLTHKRKRLNINYLGSVVFAQWINSITEFYRNQHARFPCCFYFFLLSLFVRFGMRTVSYLEIIKLWDEGVCESVLVFNYRTLHPWNVQWEFVSAIRTLWSLEYGEANCYAPEASLRRVLSNSRTFTDMPFCVWVPLLLLFFLSLKLQNRHFMLRNQQY